jgi:hypothetical protein
MGMEHHGPILSSPLLPIQAAPRAPPTTTNPPSPATALACPTLTGQGTTPGTGSLSLSHTLSLPSQTADTPPTAQPTRHTSSHPALLHPDIKGSITVCKSGGCGSSLRPLSKSVADALLWLNCESDVDHDESMDFLKLDSERVVQ